MKYFTMAEFIRSAEADRRGINNKCKEVHVERIQRLVSNVLDPLREWYGKPIMVTSGYRCPKLNAVVRGSSTSQHMKGMAADISVGSKKENKKLFEYIKDNLPFDQLINESDYSWVHVSYVSDIANRKQVLKL